MLSFLTNLFNTKNEKPFHPGVFQNPLAEEVSWTPQKRGGSNFRNTKLVRKDSKTLLIKATNGAYLFNLLFLVGPFLFLGFSYSQGGKQALSIFLEFPFVLFILVFFGIMVFNLYHQLIPKGFDKNLGYYYKSFKTPTSVREVPTSKKWVKLADVEAIQILKERVRTKNSSYRSYEINLILKDASRVNVIDHSKYERIKEEATQIADFIGVPYWDAVSMYLYQPKVARQEYDLNSDYDSTPRFREM